MDCKGQVARKEELSLLLRVRKIPQYINGWSHKEKPMKEIGGLLLQSTRLSRMLIINRNLYKIRFHPHSSIALHLWLYPNSRMTEEYVIRNCLKNGDIVIDIGANIGTITLGAAALVGSSGTIVAIEPHPTIFSYLQHNGQLNGFNNIRFLNYAVGNEEGVISFSNRMSDDQNRVVSNSRLKVNVQRLDNLLQPYGIERVNFMKIDVEGFEKHVLEGASHTLTKTECVYIETSEYRLAGYGSSLTDMFKILKDHGFNLYRVGKDTGNAIALKNLPDIMERFGTLPLSPMTTS